MCKALGIETTDKLHTHTHTRTLTHTHTRAHTHTHTHKPLCAYEDVSVLRNQAVQTDRKVTAERENMRSDRCGSTSGQEYHTARGRRGINVRVYLGKYNKF
jgi:hypothetical protein